MHASRVGMPSLSGPSSIKRFSTMSMQALNAAHRREAISRALLEVLQRQHSWRRALLMVPKLKGGAVEDGPSSRVDIDKVTMDAETQLHRFLQIIEADLEAVSQEREHKAENDAGNDSNSNSDSEEAWDQATRLRKWTTIAPVQKRAPLTHSLRQMVSGLRAELTRSRLVATLKNKVVLEEEEAEEEDKKQWDSDNDIDSDADNNDDAKDVEMITVTESSRKQKRSHRSQSTTHIELEQHTKDALREVHRQIRVEQGLMYFPSGTGVWFLRRWSVIRHQYWTKLVPMAVLASSLFMLIGIIKMEGSYPHCVELEPNTLVTSSRDSCSTTQRVIEVVVEIALSRIPGIILPILVMTVNVGIDRARPAFKCTAIVMAVDHTMVALLYALQLEGYDPRARYRLALGAVSAATAGIWSAVRIRDANKENMFLPNDDADMQGKSFEERARASGLAWSGLVTKVLIAILIQFVLLTTVIAGQYFAADSDAQRSVVVVFFLPLFALITRNVFYTLANSIYHRVRISASPSAPPDGPCLPGWTSAVDENNSMHMIWSLPLVFEVMLSIFGRFFIANISNMAFIVALSAMYMAGEVVVAIEWRMWSMTKGTILNQFRHWWNVSSLSESDDNGKVAVAAAAADSESAQPQRQVVEQQSSSRHTSLPKWYSTTVTVVKMYVEIVSILASVGMSLYIRHRNSLLDSEGAQLLVLSAVIQLLFEFVADLSVAKLNSSFFDDPIAARLMSMWSDRRFLAAMLSITVCAPAVLLGDAVRIIISLDDES
eukprot:TRINITY_DN19404_c0_g1_i1.p1 TRINITY_DN19404_c0_g1~~TRINITY_DN19404_c0_g1_i1.p1  ORF type:complete len:905 (+),score=366.79 TRINITY_DN19404_c0_g1_i1:398-2716(+)